MKNTKYNFINVLGYAGEEFFYTYNKRHVTEVNRDEIINIKLGTKVIILDFKKYNNFKFESTYRKNQGLGSATATLKASKNKIKSIKTTLFRDRKYVVVVFKEPFNFNYKSLSCNAIYNYSDSKASIIHMLNLAEIENTITTFYFKDKDEELVTTFYPEHPVNLAYDIISSFIENYLFYELTGLNITKDIDERELKTAFSQFYTLGGENQ